MRIAAFAAFVAAIHVGTASMAAQQAPNEVPPTASFSGNLFAPKSEPSQSRRFLFPTPTPRANQVRGGRHAPTPTFTCGLALIPADPNVDPGIRHDVPADAPKGSIRSVDPKVCQPR